VSCWTGESGKGSDVSADGLTRWRTERSFQCINGVERDPVSLHVPLRAKIKEVGDVVLVIIDPLTANLGVGKVNTHSGGDVRGVLTPLVELARENHFFVLGIMHFNKKQDVSDALLRISDSLAFGPVARHCFAVTDDAANKRKLLVKAKNNLAVDVKALSYGIGAVSAGRDPVSLKEIWAPRIEWGLEHVEISAVQAMQAEGSGDAARNPRNEAKEFLLRIRRMVPCCKKRSRTRRRPI
jgi:hypothetical protein